MKIQPSKRVRFLVFLVGAVTCCARGAFAQSASGISAEEAAKRLQWLKSTEVSATPQPAAPAPKKRFSETRGPIVRFADASNEAATGTNAPAEKTQPPATARSAHVAESKPAEPPAKSTPPLESKTAGAHRTAPANSKLVETHAAETQAKATPAATAKSTASRTETASTKGGADAAKPGETPRPSEATAGGKKIAGTRSAEVQAKTTPAPKPGPVASKSDDTKGAKRIAETRAADGQSKTTSAPAPGSVASKPTVTPAHSESGANSKRIAETKPSTPAPTITPAPKPSVVATTKRIQESPRIAQSTPTPAPAPDSKYTTFTTRSERGASRYPWKMQIVTTVFWIGEPVGGNNFTPNCSSSWDANWTRSYGGYDNPKPEARRNFLPANFTPHQNPFYVALPYNDVTRGTTKPEARVIIPWFREAFRREGQSVCRDRWVAVRNRAGQVAYAQWSDCGPFRTDHWQYVFGMERPKPNLNQGAGLDVSPAMRDYLGLQSTDITDWRFVEAWEVPNGPWGLYGDNNPLALRRTRLTKTTTRTVEGVDVAENRGRSF